MKDFDNAGKTKKTKKKKKKKKKTAKKIFFVLCSKRSHLDVHSDNVNVILRQLDNHGIDDGLQQSAVAALGVEDGRVRRAVGNENGVLSSARELRLLLEKSFDPLGDPERLHDERLRVQRVLGHGEEGLVENEIVGIFELFAKSAFARGMRAFDANDNHCCTVVNDQRALPFIN
jgi:hypothetical protein